MSSSNKKLTRAVATIEQLIEAIAQLNSVDEGKLKDALTSGKLSMPLRLDPDQLKEALNDFASDEELVDASPLPLSIKQHFELIRASMPLSSYEKTRLQNDSSSQGEREGLSEFLSAIRALISEEDQKSPADGTTQDKS